MLDMRFSRIRIGTQESQNYKFNFNLSSSGKQRFDPGIQEVRSYLCYLDSRHSTVAHGLSGIEDLRGNDTTILWEKNHKSGGKKKKLLRKHAKKRFSGLL